jgi:hypothetical protein
MASVPTGTQFFIASAIASSKATTVVTNASEAVVTSAAHGYTNGDIVLVTSGWGRVNNRGFRIKSVTTDTFVLEGMDTSNTSFFPAGSGIGTVSKVTTFTQISQVMNPATSGGDPKDVTYKYTESDVENKINDGFTATSYTMELDADAIGGAGYAALLSLTNVQTTTLLKMLGRNGSLLFVPCTVALNEAVSLQDGQINRCKVAFNGSNKAVRYAS